MENNRALGLIDKHTQRDQVASALRSLDPSSLHAERYAPPSSVWGDDIASIKKDVRAQRQPLYLDVQTSNAPTSELSPTAPTFVYNTPESSTAMSRYEQCGEGFHQ